MIQMRSGLVRAITPLARGLHLAALVLVAVVLLPKSGMAQKILDRLETPQGPLLIRTAKGADCNWSPIVECTVVVLGEKVLFANVSAGIAAVYPTRKQPQLIAVFTHPGGNMTPASTHLVDVTTSPPIVMEDVALGGFKFLGTEKGVAIEQYVGDDELGDPLFGLFQYVPGSGKLDLVSKAPRYNFTPLKSKQHAYDVLSDPVVREPLVTAMGTKRFAGFRKHLAVGGNLEWEFQRFVIGKGCAAHACGFRDGIFVIDTVQNRAWAIEREGEKGRAWGVLTESDKTPRRILDRWLTDMRLSWSAVAAPIPPASGSLAAEGEQTKAASRPADATGKVSNVTVGAGLFEDELPPVQLFERVARNVYVVKAPRAGGELAHGSAVAVSRQHLLTNCHVVNGAVQILVRQGKISFRATLVSANPDADRCVLKVDGSLPSFAAIRAYSDVRIGERAFSIGAPFELELTFADGLVSGKRRVHDVRFVQTTAAISMGSSGGGLFDARGNLIGITTLTLRDAQGLNFAIAADEFVR